MKIAVVTYSDPYTHSECEGDCCGMDSKDIVGLAEDEESVDYLIKKHMKNTLSDITDYDVVWVNVLNKQEIIIKEL